MLRRTEILLVAFFLMFLSGCAGGSLSSLLGKTETANHEAALVATPTPAALHKITLLLPLKGEIAPTSQAIKNGFLAAFYQARSQHPDLNINVVDTTNANIGILYQQAVASGANIIVGPLTKQEVEQLSGIGSLQVPTIALNTIDNHAGNAVNNLYQFGLSPQDEVAQVAAKMYASGLKTAAIVAPAGSWGEKIVANFRDKYEAAGGQIVSVMAYESKDDLTADVCQLITANPSEMCIRHTHQNKNKKIAIARRQDVASLFLVATPQLARQIVPLFKFYYAGDLPVFSISSVYSGNPQTNLDQDINGVYFCDMPWVFPDSPLLTPEQQEIRKQLQASWPDSFAYYSKLYALGVDAFMLALNLHDTLVAPQNGFSGVTGKLVIDNYNHVYRQLEWAQFQNGSPAIIH
jgi:uncharacterized protein